MAPLRRLPLLLLLGLPALAQAQNDEPAPAMCQQLDLGALPSSPLDKLVLTADSLRAEREGLADLAGSVRLRLGDKEFVSDALQYNDEQRRIQINKASQFRSEDYLIRAERAQFDLNSETGLFEDSEFTLGKVGARGSARSIQLSRAGEASAEEISYTSCSPGDDSWTITAGRLYLNREEGLGTARNATRAMSPLAQIRGPGH